MDKYWIVNHDADTTETGLLMHRTYIKTIWQGFPAQQHSEEDILADFCYHRFGNKTAYVQGVAPCSNWRISPSTEDEYKLSKPIMWGGMPTKTMQLILGIGDHGKVEILSETRIA
jgi:hypothetical protein